MSGPGQGQVPCKDTAWPHVPAVPPRPPHPLTLCLLCHQFGPSTTLHGVRGSSKWNRRCWGVTAPSSQPPTKGGPTNAALCPFADVPSTQRWME